MPGHLSARELASERTHERTRAFDARGRSLSNERTSCAGVDNGSPRRRSYFTPRSSIIHAVNNAPLFRVTLYRGLLPTPSFFPALRPVRPPGWPTEGLSRRSLRTTTRPGCVLYPVRTLLSPGLSSETETRGLVLSLARSLAVSMGRPVYVSWNSRGNRDDDEGTVSHPSPVDH